jgi:predicted methyltransferase
VTAEGQGVRALFRRIRGALKRAAYSGPRRDRWQQPDRVVAALGLRAGDRVADLGAGGGYFTFRLARAVGPSGVLYVVDTDRDMTFALAEAAARNGLRNVVVVDARPEDACLSEPVDLVFLANTYHHIPDPSSYFERLAGRLRPGGRVAIVEARPIGLHRLIGHATPPAQIRASLERAGYRTVADLGFLPRQSFMIFQRAGDGDHASPAARPARGA